MNQANQVKEAIDLVALIGERVKLVKAGKNFKGLCPFHSEKSPSFFVNPELQRYICFGCQEHGDCFSFLEKYDSMTFSESLRFLAKRAGIELESYIPSPQDAKRDRLLSILSLTKEYYSFLLTQHQVGKTARAYLKDRGIYDSSIELFGIGYSMNSWDGLQRYLIGKKKYTMDDLIEAGLVIHSSRGGYYDRFRNRLMFPLTNSRGQVLGFSGRVLDTEAKEAKYINSPETSLYHKSDLLFGYSQLHRFISQKEEVLVMEGEFDVLSSFQAHVENAVAIKGSALTQSQLSLLSRVAKRIILSLDSDEAGVKATKRAIELAKDVDVSLRVLPLIGGKDPDDLARETPKEWREHVKQSVSVYDYLIDQSFVHHSNLGGEEKRAISKELSPIISQISNAVEQEHYVQKIAKKLDVSEETFFTEVKKSTLPLRNLDQGLSKNIQPKPRETILLEYALSLLFHLNGPAFGSYLHKLLKLPQTRGTYHKLLELALPFIEDFIIAQYMNVLPEELKEVFSALYLSLHDEPDESTLKKELEDTVNQLELLSKKQLRQEIAQQISELEELSELSPQQQEELASLSAKMHGSLL